MDWRVEAAEAAQSIADKLRIPETIKSLQDAQNDLTEALRETHRATAQVHGSLEARVARLEAQIARPEAGRSGPDGQPGPRSLPAG